jgi:hypothetical protein
MDFTNATIKYYNLPGGDGDKIINVTYPPDPINGSIKKLCVPMAEDNTHYQEIMKWVAEGNVIEEAD